MSTVEGIRKDVDEFLTAVLDDEVRTEVRVLFDRVFLRSFHSEVRSMLIYYGQKQRENFLDSIHLTTIQYC